MAPRSAVAACDRSSSMTPDCRSKASWMAVWLGEMLSTGRFTPPCCRASSGRSSPPGPASSSRPRSASVISTARSTMAPSTSRNGMRD